MFSEEQIEELQRALHEWRDRSQELVATLARRQFRSQLGEEYGKHGLARRISTLRHCLSMVFDALPLNESQPPREAIMNATIGIQSFCLNVVGALDNLARVWIYESRAFEAVEVPRRHIGLGPENETVRASLPAQFRGYLETFDDWFDYILNYRHALAHRIPIYIPPRSYRPHEVEERSRLERQLWDAVLAGNADEVEDHEEAINRLGTFDASLMHSFTENARPVRLHPQMICDIGSVVEMAERLLPFLDVE